MIVKAVIWAAWSWCWRALVCGSFSMVWITNLSCECQQKPLTMSNLIWATEPSNSAWQQTGSCYREEIRTMNKIFKSCLELMQDWNPTILQRNRFSRTCVNITWIEKRKLGRGFLSKYFCFVYFRFWLSLFVSRQCQSWGELNQNRCFVDEKFIFISVINYLLIEFTTEWHNYMIIKQSSYQEKMFKAFLRVVAIETELYHMQKFTLNSEWIIWFCLLNQFECWGSCKFT